MVGDRRYWNQILIEQFGNGKCGVKMYEYVWISELTDRFGWSVNIKSMQEELCLYIWVGSFIVCWNPLQDVNESNSVPSVVLMSSDHQEVGLALKSSLAKVKIWFSLIYI